ITIETGTDVDGDIFLSLAGDTPLIEFVPSRAAIAGDAFLGDPTGAVAAYTLHPNRVSFELSAPMLVLRELAPPPSEGEVSRRFIVDLTAVSDARFRRSAARDADALSAALTAPIQIAATEPDENIAAAAPAPSFKPWGLDTLLDAAKAPRKIIVIDPGHGGRDPGASSSFGGNEKDIVLAVSKLLKARLEADPRYDVYLTRDSDVYVDHEDRVSKARDWKADLFISVHVDASRSPETNGASVYSIDARGERRKEGAARQNGWHMPIGEVESSAVEGILKDLVKRETKSNSVIFGEMVLPELASAGPLLRNPFRKNNFAVLLAPDVPAVLLELGFITNRADAKRLKSKRGQAESADAIKRAIDAYFDRQDLKLAAN
ncbi:MAG: N-acetylmuramoyl-L-alanine amidase, partial [Pseudomonadota bacterium]